MTLDELIDQLQAVKAKHGGGCEVVARAFGDYLESNPTLFVEERHQYSGRNGWTQREPFEDEKPLRTATVVFLDN